MLTAQNSSAAIPSGSAQKVRKPWIDGLRAIAMLLVIFGHQLSRPAHSIFVFTNPIKVPLFFVITGYVFNDKRSSVGLFFKNLLFKLVIPWISVSVLILCYNARNRGWDYLIDGIRGTLTGEYFWYMSCCIMAEIIWFFTRKFGRKTWATCVIALSMFALGLVAAHFDVLNFAMLNRAMIAQLYILGGFMYKKFEDRIVKIKWGYLIALISLYIVMGVISIIVWPNRCIDVHMNNYYVMPYAFAMIILGCFCIFAAAQKIGKAPRVLTFIGQNTFIYYMAHTPLIRIFVRVLSLMNITLSNYYVGVAVKTIAGCLLCAVAAVVLNRFLPELVGRKRKPREKKTASETA